LQPADQRQGRRFTPISDRLSAEVLREPLREFLPHDEQYEDAFDQFEYLLSLAYADFRERDGRLWAPAGTFGWRQMRRRELSVRVRVEAEAEAAGESWGLLRSQLFDGSLDRFRQIKTAYDQEVLPHLHVW
jgi:hypothetical protein